jgi:hypothetical protein
MILGDDQQKIYNRIKDTIDKYIGEGINTQVIYNIKVGVQRVLHQAVTEGILDAIKLQKDGNVEIKQSQKNPRDLEIRLPRWLEKWFSTPAPVEEILEAPPEGETLVEKELRIAMNEEMAKLPRYEES